ncbi:ribosome maturation factor [Chryseotalea sanaruensis]|uniref:Ribosome maturation factor RimP n=1 Tax=Chryseotalea sanaruensis TaxID=2482724 RepID=A0A401U7L8_9BACT|nr:ribosome maturation factor RimP [Chryseotalea sanaruensis]GCC50883.1 ribosome maturation factor [Chryseotalea sanaruensis]
MDLADNIRQLAEGLLSNDSLFIVEVSAVMKRKPGKILVVLDGDDGVSIEDCANLSRKLSESLDEQPEVDENYLLEVTTPGLDQPLKLHRQYKKNIGRTLKVKVKEENTPAEGTLTAVTESAITLSQKSGKGKKAEEKDLTIPFELIDKAFVTVSFK